MNVFFEYFMILSAYMVSLEVYLVSTTVLNPKNNDKYCTFLVCKTINVSCTQTVTQDN